MQSNSVAMIPVDKIVSRPQVRRTFDPNELEELAASIREVGVQQPIQVSREGENFVILFGERRWRACKLSGLQTVPAIVVGEEMNDSAILQAQLIENLQRADLSPLEQAEGVDRIMKESGCTAADAAKRIGRSPATVSKLLSLLTLPANVRSQIAAGEIGIRAGHALARGVGRSILPTESHRKQKLTAVLDRDRSIILIGIDSTMDATIDATESLAALLKAARKQGMELPTALAMFRDRAGF